MRELFTERLHLRRLAAGDADAVFQNWASDPEVTKYLTWEPHESVIVTQAILASWLGAYADPKTYRWGIADRRTGALMGMIDVVGYHHGNPVIGYVLGRAFWNRGYMTEACGAVMEQLREDGYGTIVIEAADANIASNRVIEKSGFRLVGTWERPIKEARPDPIPVNSYRYYMADATSEPSYTEINAATIDRWVEEGWEWGIPVSREDCERARRGDWQVVLTPTKPVPAEWFGGSLNGKRILGLASGGGQQMPLFAMAGAECWVLDYSERQIAAEQAVAQREGYRIHAIRADMTRPLPFSDGFFDLIFHPVSNCYIREVEPVWKECARILKPGGRLLAGLDNGFNYLFQDEEDETHVNGYLPFDPLHNEKQRRLSIEGDYGMQFSHTIAEQIGGQLRAGLRLVDVYDDTNGSGTLHEHGAPCFWATLAIK